MAGKVFFSVTMSLDGFIAPEGHMGNRVDAGRVAPEPVRAEPTQRVTHLSYAVRERELSRPQRSPAEVSSAVRSSTL